MFGELSINIRSSRGREDEEGLVVEIELNRITISGHHDASESVTAERAVKQAAGIVENNLKKILLSEESNVSSEKIKLSPHQVAQTREWFVQDLGGLWEIIVPVSGHPGGSAGHDGVQSHLVVPGEPRGDVVSLIPDVRVLALNS